MPPAPAVSAFVNVAILRTDVETAIAGFWVSVMIWFNGTPTRGYYVFHVITRGP